MKKLVSASDIYENIDPLDILADPTFQAVLNAYGIKDDQQTDALRELMHYLNGYEFIVGGIKERNLWDLLCQCPMPKPHKRSLIGVMASVLQHHQVHARNGLGVPAYDWPPQHPVDDLESTNYWVTNWMHAVEELLNLLLMTKYCESERSAAELAVSVGIVSMGSVLTDSIKAPGLPDLIAHHLNAAEFFKAHLAALLPLTDEEKAAIYLGILEHQYCPPFIMSTVMRVLFGNKLDASVVDPIIERILHPFGGWQAPVQLEGIAGTTCSIISDPSQIAALQSIDRRFTGWYLPTTTASKDIVRADALQYFGIGYAKCMMGRGPRTGFADPNMEVSATSISGSGEFSSSGACEHAFDTERTHDFYVAQLNAAHIVHQKAKKMLRQALLKNEVFMALNLTLPPQFQARIDAKGNLENVTFLDVDLPGEMVNGRFAYTDPEGVNKSITDAAVMVRNEYVKLFRRLHREAVRSGEFYKDIQFYGAAGRQSIHFVRRRSSDIDVTNPDAAASLVRQLSGSDVFSLDV